MFVIQDVARWIVGIVMRFPVAVRPGLFIALLVLLAWVLVRRGRWILWLGVRAACLMTDVSIGIALLAEFHWTRHRRQQGKAAAELAVTAGKAAERVLDFACNAYELPKAVAARGHWRSPIIWGVLFCAASVLLFELGTRPPPNVSAPLAAHVWRYWIEIKGWARGR
jgi:hypothetical protein